MSVLSACDIVAFVGASSSSNAKAFYQEKLGLPLLSDDGFALVFEAHGTMLRAAIVGKVTPLPYTVLGWAVSDIETTAKELTASGIMFEKFNGMQQDEFGVWTAPGGAAKVAWFKDLDGNVLSISQH